MATAATPARRPVTVAQVTAVEGRSVFLRPDRLVTEEPLEIRVHGPGEAPVPLAVTMRTPGHDFELAVGFCVTEGVVAAIDDIVTVEYCLGGRGEQEYNVVTVRVRRPIAAGIATRRFVTTSSCGVCGKATIDDLEVRCEPVGPGPSVARSVLVGLNASLGEGQSVFTATGGLHAAARFHADGSLLALREDVGRHNALDKLLGHAFLDGSWPLGDDVVLVSGRLGFELVQKAAVAGVAVVCAVSAPTSLAIETARRFGQTVVAFLRDDRFNVYTHPERVDLDG
ncbi:MAG TPA: formate dehydrogenase accessory sulfurtransferase FdhD [Acidimicrobiia bacterium]|nr:formate dehydrogenase accessory sulfurtransferase FdhD [Acidimicrobiia bacterium]